MVAGCTWAALTFWDLRSSAGGPGADLGTALTFWAVLAYGIAGLAALSAPFAIGVTARTRRTRLGAAWTGATISALAGILWLLMADPAGLSASRELLRYSSAAVLGAPLLLTAAASR